MPEFFSKLVVFDLPTSTGNLAVTGVGFQPKALILYGCNALADGWSNTVPGVFVGAVDEAGGQWATASVTDDGTQDGACILNESTCLQIFSNAAGAIDAVASFVSFDSDGFTIDVTNAPASAGIKVGAIALGGLDCQSAVAFTSVTANGAWSVSGLAFSPEVVFHVGTKLNGAGTDATAAHLGIGFFTAGVHRHYDYQLPDGGSADAHTASNDRIIRHNRTAGGTTGFDWDGSLTSINADGFTFSAGGGPLEGQRRAWLCIAGGDHTVGTITIPGANTAPGFPTNVLITIGCGSATFNIPVGSENYGLGAGDRTSRMAIAHRIAGSSSGVYRDTTLDWITDTDTNTNTLEETGNFTIAGSGFTTSEVVTGGAKAGWYWAIAGDLPPLGGGNRWWWWRGSWRCWSCSARAQSRSTR